MKNFKPLTVLLYCGHRRGQTALALRSLAALAPATVVVVDDLARDSVRRLVQGQPVLYRATPCLGWSESCARALEGLPRGPVLVCDDRGPWPGGLEVPALDAAQIRACRSLAELQDRLHQPAQLPAPLVEDTALGMLVDLEEALAGGGRARPVRIRARLQGSRSWLLKGLGVGYLAYWFWLRPVWTRLNRFQQRGRRPC